MSEAGYSSEYEVYLTENNGVQIVINSLSLSILKVMRFREVSPTKIASLLDVPKTTIQGNINKLMRTGIVRQDTSVDDTRSVVYHISAMLLFSSESDIGWQLSARSASVTRIMRVGRCTSAEDISLYGVSLTESGLNIVQGLFNVGVALVEGRDDREWWDDLFDKITEQSQEHGIKVDMDSKDGLKLVFESETEDISDMPMVMFPMLGALISKSKMLFGYQLAHDTSLYVTDGGHHVEMNVPRFEGQDFDNNISVNMNSDSCTIEEPFSIYSIKGRAMLFTNPTMMAILDRLTGSDLSLAELEEETGLSKATVYTAVTKLMSLGAVDSDKLVGSVTKYTLVADPIMYTSQDSGMDPSRLDDVVKQFNEGEIDYYAAIISYAMTAIGCIGIHFDKMFIRAGRNAALSVLEAEPDIPPQKFVELACDMVSIPDRAEIVTYIPILIQITLSKDTLWESWPGDFVAGFLSEGLKRLLGTGYKIRMVVCKDGQEGSISSIDL